MKFELFVGRLRVCFVVVACSDATLTLRALLLSHRLWYAECGKICHSPILHFFSYCLMKFLKKWFSFFTFVAFSFNP